MVTTNLSDHGVFHSALSQTLPHRKIDSQKDRPHRPCFRPLSVSISQVFNLLSFQFAEF